MLNCERRESEEAGRPVAISTRWKATDSFFARLHHRSLPFVLRLTKRDNVAILVSAESDEPRAQTAAQRFADELDASLVSFSFSILDVRSFSFEFFRIWSFTSLTLHFPAIRDPYFLLYKFESVDDVARSLAEPLLLPSEPSSLHVDMPIVVSIRAT